MELSKGQKKIVRSYLAGSAAYLICSTGLLLWQEKFSWDRMLVCIGCVVAIGLFMGLIVIGARIPKNKK